MIQLNTLRAWPGSTTNRKRLGRGAASGQGGTAGKGHKGQLARSGGKIRPRFEGGQTPLYRRMPKRGFRSFKPGKAVEINLGNIALLGLKEVSLAALYAAGQIGKTFDRLHVLGTGELKGAVQVKAHRVSAGAREKIEKAGGTVEIVVLPKLVRKKRKGAKS